MNHLEKCDQPLRILNSEPERIQIPLLETCMQNVLSALILCGPGQALIVWLTPLRCPVPHLHILPMTIAPA